MANFMKAYWLTLILAAICATISAIRYIYVNNIIYVSSSDDAVIWVSMQIFVWLFSNLFISVVIGMPYFLIVRFFTQFNYCWAVMMGVLAGFVNLLFITGREYLSQWWWFLGGGLVLGLILGGMQIFFDKRSAND
ncbi:hypothetical protein N5853_14670 (plasmid) [Bartonella sp. HY329]|uniref:hypothetical protein n=1 Tax=unclassified Bartonella TaxID=2645622 RepID=UPI0021C61A9D|nr:MULTISPECIES: hypothetical protein [unclassified Bartonella]UXM96559.1 hypothetical protein N5853_14670 [Bartonella sp. HY329]UXN10882.1 hypothetical protein N5852_14675 [Bartonella sp. HY328]